MKLKFDDNLEYQLQAIASVVDLFSGQTPMHTNFTVSAYSGQIGLFDTANGVGNRLELDKEEILSNLQNIQLRNRLPQTATLKAGMYDFDIEMETGTGKTYVYIRTILELHKNYGFSKFIIVVPNNLCYHHPVLPECWQINAFPLYRIVYPYLLHILFEVHLQILHNFHLP
jgi:type III restriction enzyme